MRSPRHLLESRSLAALAIGSAVALLVLALRLLGALEMVEFELYDRFVGFRPPRLTEPRIVLIRIYEEDLRRHGYPISDAKLAEGLEILLGQDPTAIGVDLLRDLPVGTGRERLCALVSQNPRIILGDDVSPNAEGRDPTLPCLEDRDRVGFVNLVPDYNDVNRRALLFQYRDGEAFVSLAARLALGYLAPRGIRFEQVPEDPWQVALGGATIERFRANDGPYVRSDDGGFQLLMDFGRRRIPFESFSFSRLLERRIKPEAIAGKVVLLGTTAPSVPDLHQTPLNTGRSVAPGISGLDLHAHVVDQLLRMALDGDPGVRHWSEPSEAGWTLLWSVLAVGLGLLVRSPWRLLPLLFGLVALVGGLAYLAMQRSLWIPVVPPSVAALAAGVCAVAYGLLREQAERAQVMDLFGRFVSRDVAKRLWERRQEFLDQGRPRPQRVVVTILMSDLKGFTGAAEAMEPPELMGWINSYMSEMSKLAEHHHGIVDDYAGDGIKVDFGIPIPREHEEEVVEDALRAVRCALAMGERLEQLNRQWTRDGLPTGRMRIGIYTGDVVVGTLGSLRRQKYTTLGDTVNVAARLESFDKESFEDESVCFRILVGEPTWIRVRDHFTAVPLGKQFLKGKDEPVGIYRIAGPKGE